MVDFKTYPVGYDNTEDDVTSIFVPADDTSYDSVDTNDTSSGGGGSGCLASTLILLASAVTFMSTFIIMFVNVY
jgi:hypothetical protein